MAVLFLSLPHVVTSIILDMLNVPTIKTLRAVCTTTKMWVDKDFWSKTQLTRLEFPWFRDENFASLANVLDHHKDQFVSLTFTRFSQTHFYAPTIFSRICKFINTQFANTTDLPIPNFLLRPKSSLTFETVYPTPEQDLSRRFAGRPLHYNVEFMFEFGAGRGRLYHVTYAMIQQLVKSAGIREQAKLDGVMEFELILGMETRKLGARNGGGGGRILQNAKIRLQCSSSVDRRGCMGTSFAAPQDIFRSWTGHYLQRDLKEEEKWYRESYLPKIVSDRI